MPKDSLGPYLPQKDPQPEPGVCDPLREPYFPCCAEPAGIKRRRRVLASSAARDTTSTRGSTHVNRSAAQAPAVAEKSSTSSTEGRSRSSIISKMAI